jgi:predicted transcriptional regulator
LSSNGSNKKGKMIDWRRNKVQQLLVRGYSQWDVAEELQIDQSTLSRDIHYLRHQAQANLHKHIQQKLPEEYQRCLTGMNQVLKLSWQIANNNTLKQNDQDHNDNINTITMGDDRIRLQALSLINDCYKYIMDLTTNGVVITDAIKFVQTNKEKLTMSTKEDNGKESKEPDYDEDKDQLEEEQEEETGEQETTNQVF